MHGKIAGQNTIFDNNCQPFIHCVFTTLLLNSSNPFKCVQNIGQQFEGKINTHIFQAPNSIGVDKWENLHPTTNMAHTRTRLIEELHSRNDCSMIFTG